MLGNDGHSAFSVVQVRVRLREERPPLEETKFRPILFHYDGPKFRLELTVAEVSSGSCEPGGEWRCPLVLFEV